MIEVVGLRRTFGRLAAVEDVSFSVARGEIFGLLGPNGAGKTTTLRMLYGLLPPTAGELRIDGVDVRRQPREAQKRLGVLPDNGGLYTRLTARENIRYFGELQGMTGGEIRQRVDYLVAVLRMEDIIDRKTKGFSQGERMKVSLARALVHDPDYILLDEPTNGLDVLTTRALRRLLLELRAAGKAIVFSSHLMHEVAQLCDRVAIVVQGRVRAQGTVEQVLAQAGVSAMEEAFVHFAYGGEETGA